MKNFEVIVFRNVKIISIDLFGPFSKYIYNFSINIFIEKRSQNCVFKTLTLS
jgi:hypothetical protein